MDPTLSFGIAIWILFNAYGNLKQVMKIFLQAVPVSLNRSDLIEKWQEIEGVKSVNDIKIWSLDGIHHVASLHVLIDKKLKPKHFQSLKEQIRKIAVNFKIIHTTIEIETEDEVCNIQLS